MLVAVALVAVFSAWMAREVAFVRQRASFARRAEVEGVLWMSNLAPLSRGAYHFSIPFWRRWLGDDAAAFVHIRDGYDGSEAHRLFPEANITYIGADGHVKGLIPPKGYESMANL